MTVQMFGAALAPVWAPATLVQCVAAVASGGDTLITWLWPGMLIWSGCTTSFITNPLDVVRARVQVCNLGINCVVPMSEIGPSPLNDLGLWTWAWKSYFQVHRRSIPDTIRHLWRTERWSVFRKGLTARMTSSSIYSLAVIFGYESVKKMSVLPQYKHVVSWWWRETTQWF